MYCLQLGEDFVLYICMIAVLPVTQEYFLFPIFRAPLDVDALPPPTYSDIVRCFVLLALLLETITTIITFHALLKSGIHLDHR
jgi:hypothetical protein